MAALRRRRVGDVRDRAGFVKPLDGLRVEGQPGCYGGDLVKRIIF
jgi:hypothetical protein